MPTSVDLVDGRFEERGERDAAVAAQPLVDPLHVDVDRRFVVADAFGAGDGVLGLEHAAERADQVPQLDFLNRLLIGRRLAGRQVVGQARKALAPLAAALFEHAGRVAILLVLEQPANQLLPRILELVCTSSSPGSAARDFISISRLAISRKSPTASTSICSSTAMYSRNWSVTVAMRMSTTSSSCLRTR